MMPVHHSAQEYVVAYLEVAELGENGKGALFRSCAVGRQDRLEKRAMTRATALRMIKRRELQAGLPAEICVHGFRETGITEYLRNGGELEIAARMAGHESTRTRCDERIGMRSHGSCRSRNTSWCSIDADTEQDRLSNLKRR